MPLFRPRMVLLHFFFHIGSTGMMKCVYKCLAHEDILYVLWFGGLLGCHGLLCLWRSFASRKSVERSMIGTKLQSALGSLETPEFWWTPTASSRNTDWREFGETGALKKHVNVCILIFPITIGLAFGIHSSFHVWFALANHQNEIYTGICIQEICNKTHQTDPYLMDAANPYEFLGGLLVRSRSVFQRI